MNPGDWMPGEWVDAVCGVPHGPQIVVGLAIIVGCRLILVPIVRALWGRRA